MFALIGIAVLTSPIVIPVDCAPTPLSCNIFMEARGEGILGMGAVSFSTLNRMDHKYFQRKNKKSLSSLVKSPNQYSWVQNNTQGKRTVIQITPQERLIWELSKVIALSTWTLKTKYPNLYRKLDYTGGALFYHEEHSHPTWASKKYQTLQLGAHHFYSKDKNGYPK